MPAKKQLFTENSKLIVECRNVFGGLKGDVRKRLLAVLNNPCQRTWQDAHTIIITGARMTSLWQAVIAVSPNFTRSKSCEEPWPLIPDQFNLCRAIRHATSTVAAARAEEELIKTGGVQRDTDGV
jgi:hypothetical protein